MSPTSMQSNGLTVRPEHGAGQFGQLVLQTKRSDGYNKRSARGSEIVTQSSPSPLISFYRLNVGITLVFCGEFELLLPSSSKSN